MRHYHKCLPSNKVKIRPRFFFPDPRTSGLLDYFAMPSLLRQNVFDQLEYRRQVLVLRFGQIEIFLAVFKAIVRIDFVFGNIDAAGIVRVGPAEFLQRKLPLSG